MCFYALYAIPQTCVFCSQITEHVSLFCVTNGICAVLCLKKELTQKWKTGELNISKWRYENFGMWEYLEVFYYPLVLYVSYTSNLCHLNYLCSCWQFCGALRPWRVGVRRMGPSSFQWCPVTGQGAMGTN